MLKLVQFPTQEQAPSQERSDHLAAILETLTKNTRDGSVRGFWFVADMGGGRHEYCLEGTYADNPASVYFPACKSMYVLSAIIHENGGL